MILPGGETSETYVADEVFVHLGCCDALLGSSYRHTGENA
jgi:hypothetical protein